MKFITFPSIPDFTVLNFCTLVNFLLGSYEIPELNIKRDIPIVLNSVNYEDTYDGNFSQRRAVIYTLGFTAKTYLFGPASTQKVIKNVQSDAYTDTDQTNKAREVRIVITPDPTTADADDDFGFTTTISNFSDGKKYNTTTDSDE